MCLACTRFAIKGKKEIKKIFDFSFLTKLFPEKKITIDQWKSIGLTGNYLHTHDNKTIEVTAIQLKEIIDNAVAIVATGVDTQVNIWSIQWPNDYKPVNF